MPVRVRLPEAATVMSDHPADLAADQLLRKAALMTTFKAWDEIMQVINDLRSEAHRAFLAEIDLRDARRAELAVDGDPSAWRGSLLSEAILRDDMDPGAPP